MRQIRVFENKVFTNKSDVIKKYLTDECIKKGEEPYEAFPIRVSSDNMSMIVLSFSNEYRVFVFNDDVCVSEVWLPYTAVNKPIKLMGYEKEDYIIEKEIQNV